MVDKPLGWRLGIVVGMTAEARLLRDLVCAVAVAGASPTGARYLARSLVDDGVTALVSFGFAGGLDPLLPAGTLIRPAAVIAEGRSYACDTALAARLAGEPVATLLAVGAPVASAAEKQRLHRETGAAAIDMESGAVAEVAAAAGLPFVVLRAISDPATRDVPAVAMNALARDGRMAIGRVAAGVLRRPAELGALLALARDAARARQALIRGAESLRRLAPGDADTGRLGL